MTALAAARRMADSCRSVPSRTGAHTYATVSVHGTYAADRSPSAEHDDDERSSDAVTCTRERRLLLQHTPQCNAPTVLLWHKHSSKAVKRRESLGRIARVELNVQRSVACAVEPPHGNAGLCGPTRPNRRGCVGRWSVGCAMAREHTAATSASCEPVTDAPALKRASANGTCSSHRAQGVAAATPHRALAVLCSAAAGASSAALLARLCAAGAVCAVCARHNRHGWRHCWRSRGFSMLF